MAVAGLERKLCQGREPGSARQGVGSTMVRQAEYAGAGREMDLAALRSAEVLNLEGVLA